MGFNYGKEKKLFDAEWKKKRIEYQLLGMNEESICKLYNFDLEEFRSRRIYENHTQLLPDEEIDDESSKTTAFQKFPSLAVGFDESDMTDRYAWIDTIEQPHLARQLKKLSKDDLELLTLIAIEGYSQSELARKTDAVQSVISRKLSRIKKILKKF